MLARTIVVVTTLLTIACAAAQSPPTDGAKLGTVRFTGESHASSLLKADTLKLITAHLKEHGCEAVAHVDARVFSYEPSNGTKDHVWGKEGWMVTACGAPHRFYLTFKEDGVGGTDIQIQTK